MKNVEISSIKVGDRFRKEFIGIEDLAISIEKYSLIEPIVLDEDNNLIAGERRLKAHILLKRTTIEAKYITELTELQKKEIELEENIQRKAFTWQEEVEAKRQLHELKRKIYGNAVHGHKKPGTWQLKDTAGALGETIGTVSMDITLAKGIQVFPELMKEKHKTTAYKKLKQIQTRIINEEFAKRMKRSKIIAHPSIIHGNCIEELLKMDAESVDLVVTDPPYGIDVDNAHTFKRMTFSDTNFADSAFETFDLLDKVFKELYRVLKKDTHMYVFFAIDKYQQVISLLTKHGFEVHPMPLIWDKGSGSYPSQSTSYVHSYEPLLHVFKGKRKLNGTPKDVFTIKRVPSGSKIHATQKPTELLRDLIGFSSAPGDLVLDPFAGSGSTIVAAKETQRRAIGIEINSEFYTKIISRLGTDNKEDPDMAENLEEGMEEVQ